MFNTLLVQPLANGLIIFYRLLGHNLGLAIVGFSLFLRFVLNPLTKPYMESMKKMKDLAPDLERLKQKYKGDKMKLAKAQSDFYREKKINPGSGCLPYILQIVILIAFFNVFTKTLSTGADVTQKFNELLYQPLRFTEDQKINTRFLYLDVVKPDVFNIDGVPFPLPGPIILLAAIIQFLSTKMMSPATQVQNKKAKSTPGAADDMQAAMQQSMAFTFPLFTIIFGIRFPSGLAIYWLLFSLWQFVQQYQSYGLGGIEPVFLKLGLIKSPRNGKERKENKR